MDTPPKPLIEIWRDKDHCRQLYSLVTDGKKLEKVYRKTKWGYLLFSGEGGWTFRLYANGQLNGNYFDPNVFKIVDLLRSLGYEPEKDNDAVLSN